MVSPAQSANRVAGNLVRCFDRKPDADSTECARKLVDDGLRVCILREDGRLGAVRKRREPAVVRGSYPRDSPVIVGADHISHPSYTESRAAHPHGNSLCRTISTGTLPIGGDYGARGSALLRYVSVGRALEPGRVAQSTTPTRSAHRCHIALRRATSSRRCAARSWVSVRSALRS
jgi:hypothetical protein